MILGLVGQAGAGKDTVAAYLIKEHGFERLAFADPLKRSIALFLDIPYWEVDRLKNDDTAKIAIYRIDDNLIAGRLPVSRELTFREALQRYGTESHRQVFGDDFWVDLALPQDGYYHGKKIVISDCRFQNEANRIKSIDGFTVTITRGRGRDKQEQHRSEEEQLTIDTDYVLMNESTINHLYDEVELMLSRLEYEESVT